MTQDLNIPWDSKADEPKAAAKNEAMEPTSGTKKAVTKKTEDKPVKAAPIEILRAQVGSMERQFKAVLPTSVSPEKFIRVVMTAVQSAPILIDKDRGSLFAECLKCAADGLLPNGIEAALVPFKDRVKYIPMVAGICKRIRNSGEVKSVDALVVRDGDEYDSWTDEQGPHFRHKKSLGKRGDPLLTYAYAITKDGGFYFEEVPESEMSEIKKMSKASDSPWKGPFEDEMRRKSALRRLAKYRLPSSADVDEIIRRDDDIYEAKKEQVKTSLTELNQRFSEVGAVAPELSPQNPSKGEE